MPYQDDNEIMSQGCGMIILGVIFLLAILCAAFFYTQEAHAATIELHPSTEYVTEGQEFTIDEYIVPSGEWETITAVRSILSIPEATMTNFVMSREWYPITFPEYWNDNTRTGVYGGGFNTTTLFARYTFVATATGEVKIGISEFSEVLNKDGEDVYEVRPNFIYEYIQYGST